MHGPGNRPVLREERRLENGSFAELAAMHVENQLL